MRRAFIALPLSIAVVGCGSSAQHPAVQPPPSAPPYASIAEVEAAVLAEWKNDPAIFSIATTPESTLVVVDVFRGEVSPGLARIIKRSDGKILVHAVNDRWVAV